jgi:SAM-dependent methyltransferase
MALGPAEAEFLFAEHRYQPIRGDLLTIGRQPVSMTARQFLQSLAATGTPISHESRAALDRDATGHLGADHAISAKSFFAMFPAATLSTLSGSASAPPDVTHDMNHAVGPELENRFDFIISDSCLDTVFHPVMALRNLTRMAKPGGRIVLFERGNSFPTAYMKFTPDWLLDFFALNQFADAKSYILHYPTLDDKQPFARSGLRIDAYQYDPVVEASGQFGYQCTSPQTLGYTLNVVIAQKAADSTWAASPTQMHYRLNDDARRAYVEAALRFRQSARPLFRRADGKPVSGDPALSRFGTLKPVASWDETEG